ncbi:MAG: hypothetical protein IPN69_07480 [Acidobacteria bacterium]|nr:hypothetical protein [Acidobacteriota bacterium]
MKQTRKTFSEVIKGFEKCHSERLMAKARQANRIAKTVRGRSRRIAYDVKASALGMLVRTLPDHVVVRRDIVLTDFVVVELKNTNAGLHMPVQAI